MDPTSTQNCTCISYAKYARVSKSKLAQIGEFGSRSPIPNSRTQQYRYNPSDGHSAPSPARDDESRENNVYCRLALIFTEISPLFLCRFQNSILHLPRRILNFFEPATPKLLHRGPIRTSVLPPDIISPPSSSSPKKGPPKTFLYDNLPTLTPNR